METPGRAAVQPLLPPHPPLIQRDAPGPRTVFLSPTCPRAMARVGPWALQDYILTKQLYRGKASTLYLATCRFSGQAVVLKAYSKRRLSPLNWYQVDREIRLHSGMAHENIVGLYAAFEDRDHVYLVQEYAAGGDLYEDLKRAGGQYKERQVARDILPPFLSALQYLHGRNIIHRDIKPENILLTADKVLKMADFGLSINWAEERPVTRAGTLDYMSPEVLRCPEKSAPEENKEKVLLGYSDAVDVWACGVLAYELLVGRPPFEKESRDETYRLIMHEEPAFPPWVSEGARDFITSALAKTARRRPGISDLLRHPWIQLHMRRPSVPGRATGAGGLELALDDVPPSFEQHRPSMHGMLSARAAQEQEQAQQAGPGGGSCGGSAGRASPSPLAQRPSTPMAPHLVPVSPLVPPAVVMMAAPARAAIMAAVEGQPRQEQQSAAGYDAASQPKQQRPTTPTSPAPAASAGNKGQPAPSTQPHLLSAAGLLDPTLPPVSHTPAAASKDYQGSSFMELYKSLAAAPDTSPTSPRSLSTASPPSSHHATSASRPGTGGGGKSGGADSMLPPLQQHAQQQQQQQQQVPLRTSSFRRVISQPVLHTEPLLALGPSHSAAQSEASRSSNASSSGMGTPRAYAALGVSTAGGAAEQAGQAGQAGALMASPAAAAAAAALPTILERSSTVAEAPAAPVAEPSLAAASAGPAAVPELAATAMEQGPSAATPSPQAATASPSKSPPRAKAASPAPAASSPRHARTTQEPTPVASSGGGGGGSRPGSALEAEGSSQHDRMREAEAKHIAKLKAKRERAASVHAVDLHAEARLQGGGAGSQPASPKQQAVQQQAKGTAAGSGGAGSSIARTAESLLARLLGKREAAAAAGPGSPKIKARPQTAGERKASGAAATAAATAGLARAKSDAAALLSTSRKGRSVSAAAAPTSPLSAPTSPKKSFFSAPTKAAAVGAAVRPLSPTAGARHASLAAMQVYTVTNRGVVRGKSHSTGTPGSPAARKGASTGAGRPIAGVESSGGSITLKHPQAASSPTAAAGVQVAQTEPAAAEATFVRAEAGAQAFGAEAQAQVPGSLSTAAAAQVGLQLEEAGEGAMDGPAAAAAATGAAGAQEASHHASKHVQFTGLAGLEEKLSSAQLGEGSAEGGAEDFGLIPAHRGPGSAFSTPADSFTTAASLPSLSKRSAGGSLTAAGMVSARSSLASQGSGSFSSPRTSRKSSLVVPAAAAVAAAGVRRGGATHRLGGAKGSASMPGDGAEGEAEGESGEEGAGGHQVQRSAASWSPPHAAGKRAAPSAAHGPRLNMYLAMGGGGKPRGGRG